MGWVENRIQQYIQDQKATWLEKRSLEHANPVNLLAHIIAFVAGIYGLWFHNWTWIITALIIGFLGHLYCWLKK